MEPSKRLLNPCPFCGGKDIRLSTYDPFDGYQGNLNMWEIKCQCGVMLRRRTKEEAITAWNERIVEIDFDCKPIETIKACAKTNVCQFPNELIAQVELEMSLRRTLAERITNRADKFVITRTYQENCYLFMDAEVSVVVQNQEDDETKGS